MKQKFGIKIFNIRGITLPVYICIRMGVGGFEGPSHVMSSELCRVTVVVIDCEAYGPANERGTQAGWSTPQGRQPGQPV